jgi:NADH-quinone oxidoreductase subunit J
VDLIFFYLFATAAVLASLLVIGQRNPMYSVLLLIASFCALAGLYVLLDAPFTAVTQIIVYAGAIMVLFLFVVMLLNAPREEPGRGLLGARPSSTARRLGAVMAAALAGELLWALQRAGAAAPLAGQDQNAVARVSSVREIGLVLFTEYAFAFEVTSVLILVAMVGAVVLARKQDGHPPSRRGPQ